MGMHKCYSAATTIISNYLLKPDEEEYTIDMSWLSPQHQRPTLADSHACLTGVSCVSNKNWEDAYAPITPSPGYRPGLIGN